MQKQQDLLKRIEEQEITARKFGFYWQHIDQLIDQIRNECTEIQNAWQGGDQQHLQEEIGDLLLAGISLALFCELDPSETLHKSSEKFQKRYDALVEMAKNDGFVHLQDQSEEVLLEYWNRAKKKINQL